MSKSNLSTYHHNRSGGGGSGSRHGGGVTFSLDSTSSSDSPDRVHRNVQRRQQQQQQQSSPNVSNGHRLRHGLDSDSDVEHMRSKPASSRNLDVVSPSASSTTSTSSSAFGGGRCNSRNMYAPHQASSSGHATSSGNSAMSLLSEAGSSSCSNNSQGSGTPVNRRTRTPKEQRTPSPRSQSVTSPRGCSGPPQPPPPSQHQASPQLPQPSRWQKLFSTFKKNRGPAGTGSSPSASDSHCLKHSHNCSNSQLRAGISNMKGYKKANQDRCTAFSYLEGDPELAFFAIYDGHGGTGVANYLKDHLHEFILDQPEYNEGNMHDAVVNAFLKVDGELRTYGSATELTGSTATVIMIKHGEILCANLGDSRATACVLGNVKPLSNDHNTGNPKERERVYAMGGTIKDNRVGGVLIPTRSFGDFLLKSEQDKPAWKQVISVVPQIQTFKLDSYWEFVVVGSDGVWDAMSNSEMTNFVKGRLASTRKPDGGGGGRGKSGATGAGSRDKLVLSDLCEQILDMCCAKTVGHYGKNSCDNMTIIIIWFDHGDASETGSSVVSSSISSASR